MSLLYHLPEVLKTTEVAGKCSSTLTSDEVPSLQPLGTIHLSPFSNQMLMLGEAQLHLRQLEMEHLAGWKGTVKFDVKKYSEIVSPT